MLLIREQVEMLITSKLEGFSVPASTLVEACSAGRHTRGLNMEVFNRLVALDDFLHFKKMMARGKSEIFQSLVFLAFACQLTHTYLTSLRTHKLHR